MAEPTPCADLAAELRAYLDEVDAVVDAIPPAETEAALARLREETDHA